MTSFMSFKNTVLFLLFLIISCGSKTSENSKKRIEEKDIKTNEKAIITGANQTHLYLPLLKGKNIGIVANQTSVIFKKEDQYTHLVDSLLSLKLNIKKVFSPEHGFRGTADAGEKVKDGNDLKTGLPIISLYGKNRKPTPDQLDGLDIIVFDIQDVGVRFYTYISTMHLVMEACAEKNIPIIVMDRPNPNGSYIDGPVLESQHQSFLGMHTVPLVYGMTIGEYAKMINGEKWLANGIQSSLNVIELKNYTHNSTYSLPIKPSPNLPNDHAINLYPSLGLFEGTFVNAGRGTNYQFQMYGAPFLDKEKYNYQYTPVSNEGAKYPKHKDEVCYGLDLRDETRINKVDLKWIIDAYNNTTDKTKFFNKASFTKHAGTEKLQKQIESGISAKEIKKSWEADLKDFNRKRKKYLLYE
ncbi:DUF1343 domain-containing protein [Flavobacteriaceae bacterium R38]|nr:DUF1343 domain-containing protein [Flavobacteriaceae bacterium R38]